ncbi:hypothetical protein QC762_301880 [Podospora pseudocomata]|uniref:Uncharacterized protein n=1 Tax=Podospora pseudocomata TaxID=2093779 RepID=A0ABR0GIB0_9PEZI|nr:hypothetical protein QC762_301880 [Podospora pseudocomata]
MTISQEPAIVAEAQDSNTRQVYAKAPIIVSESEVVATPTPSPGPDRYLVVSPYTEQQHLLDLDTLDTENQLLALALTQMRCLRDDYATAPYLDTFNWPDIIDTLRALANQRQHVWRKTSFYIVAFRSRIPPTTIYAELGTLDKAAHVEATSSGGFLK